MQAEAGRIPSRWRQRHVGDETLGARCDVDREEAPGRTSAGDRWVEGTCSPNGARLVLLDGVPLEAPLTGTILLFENNDQPGVVGQLGTLLGKHGINIANFSLGRTDSGSAVGAVQLDEPTPIPDQILTEIRAMKQLKAAWLVRV